MHPRVDLLDDRYTLMPEGGDERADGDVRYVTESKTWTKV
jgi:hypothetical protein